MTESPGFWTRVEAAFSELGALPPEARRRALERLGSEDPGVAEEVRSLLDAHERPGAVDTPPGPMMGQVVEELTRTLSDGELIGSFRIRRELGHGGMGEVYLADRVGADFEQRVAIKLIRAGFDTDELRARFRAERRILASLDHPGIARLVDGGVTKSGRPWLAMELVEGQSIVAYCDGRAMSVPDRLALFRRVGEIVQHAHRRLVVHRDLKPSNILVTPAGDPKLLDFGIARMLEDHDEGRPRTRTARWLTPEYASPEQVRGEPVTTASDVYSLGVMLYELLTGHRPFDLAELTPQQVATTLDETEPRAPSTVVVNRSPSTSGGDAELRTPEAISRVRATSPDQLRRTLSGDLDTIVLKAIRREARRRYGSVEALLEDVRRHLAGEPVLARPDTVRYRAGKFVRRHRVAVTATALVIVALAVGATGTAWQASRARAEAALAASERDRAEAEAAKAFRAASLLVDLLRLSDPLSQGAGEVSARDLLDAGAARAETELADQPEMQARLFAELGRIHMNVGELERARDLMQRAYDLRHGLARGPDPLVASSLVDLGVLAGNRGHPDSAIAHLEDARSILADPTVHDEALDGDVHYHLGDMLVTLGRSAEAEAAFRRAVELRRADAEAEGSEVAEALYGLANAIHGQGRFGEAGDLFRGALAIFEDQPGAPHPLAIRAMINVGSVDVAMGAYGEAEELLADAARRSAEVLGPEHAWTIEAETGLGTVYYNTARYPEAEPLLRGALAKTERTVGEAHLNATMIRQVLSATLSRLGAGAEAVSLLERNLAVQRPGQPTEVLVRFLLADAELARGDPEAARRYASEGVRLAEERFGASSPYAVLGVLSVADADRALGRFDEARGGYDRALGLAADVLPAGHRYATRAGIGLAWVHLEAGELTEARERFTDALAALRATLPDDHPESAEPLLGLGLLSAREGAAAEGEALLVQALAIRSAAYPADHRRVREVEAALREVRSPGE